MKFEMGKYVKFSCWTSIVLILWGWVTKVVEINRVSFLVLVFFCAIAIMAWANDA